MGRKRTTRIAVRVLCAPALWFLLIALPLLLTACEALPGFGNAPQQPSAAAPQPLVGPPPPPARPRGSSPAGQRFRSEPPPPAAPTAPPPDLAHAPAPPPNAPLPAIGAETSPPAQAASPSSPPTPLAGDSAAAEVARAEPAAAPPIQTPQPQPPPSIDPATLLGNTGVNLRDRFGAPDSQVPIASGMSWSYERAACKASFVLLPELASGALRVFSYEITPREGAMFGPAGCLGRIAATRGNRTAGTAP